MHFEANKTFVRGVEYDLQGFNVEANEATVREKMMGLFAHLPVLLNSRYAGQVLVHATSCTCWARKSGET
jgi:hypothetical protein